MFTKLGGDACKCGVYKTNTSKNALLITARGMDSVPDEVGNTLSSLVPVVRGNNRTIEQCYYGDESKGYKPVSEFVKLVDKYPKFLENALSIEGLIKERSQHASGVFFTNEPFENFSAKMKLKSGLVVSQYDLKSAKKAGLLKYDFLTTLAQDKIRVAMDLLIENGHIEKQATLRDTYNKYLHPHVIDITNPELWDIANKGLVPDLFQFKTAVGLQAIKDIAPRNVSEMTKANNLMRLQQSKDMEESLTERFKRMKDNPDAWREELSEWDIPESEWDWIIDILKPYQFVLDSQEGIMEVSRNDKLAQFSVAQSHKLRKAVASKNKKFFNKVAGWFYKQCRENNLDESIIDYFWWLIQMSSGYSFSDIHSGGYSLIGLQEMQLYTQYPNIYWSTSCLLNNSGSLEIIGEDDKTKSTKYGKIAVAVANMKNNGVKISPPYINKSDFGFVPDEETNSVIYGFKALNGIGDDTANNIVDNQPYKSLEDAYEKLVLTKEVYITSTDKKQNRSLVGMSDFAGLVQCGSFDKLVDKPRNKIIEDFLDLIYNERDSLNMQNFDQLMDMNIIPAKYDDCIAIHDYREYVRNCQIEEGKEAEAKSKKWVNITVNNVQYRDEDIEFFKENFEPLLEEYESYYYNDNDDLIILVGGNKEGTFSRVYSDYLEPLKDWMLTDDCLNRYNKIKRDELRNKYFGNTREQMEFDVLSCYLDEHYMKNFNYDQYEIKQYNEIPDVTEYTQEELDEIEDNHYKGITYKNYESHRIIGTILKKDNNKHLITILTPDNDVVRVKFYEGAYAHYSKQVSQEYINNNGDKKKTIVEKPWFKRGNNVVIAGYKKGDIYKPRRGKYPHTVMLVRGIDDDGSLDIKFQREKT